ncbi:hypothetical protein PoB_006339000 [Plakobranchus ocellatus]|uniref:Uncharacterized protein n=1 Tax=Plakobranchus ocellatus TaxID=259542 RepID=A0AAV4CYM5_9GAST|nr:hypothetical protein PoB_006339000 [Plakobranchus ocellatus]
MPKPSFKPRRKTRGEENNNQETYCLLTRCKFRLRTCQYHLKHHLFIKLKINGTNHCSCKHEKQRTENELVHFCLPYEALQEKIWPDPILMRQKLYRNLMNLQSTTVFIQETGKSFYQSPTTSMPHNGPMEGDTGLSSGLQSQSLMNQHYLS